MSMQDNTRRWRKTRRGLVTNLYTKMKTRKKVSLTLDELHKFSECQKFNRLFIEWERSGHKKQFKPTIDRINYKNGYEYGNIQWLSWADNRYKQRMEIVPLRATRIGRFMDEILIEEYKSVKDAVIKTGIAQASISSCLSGRLKTAAGFIWKYLEPQKRIDKKIIRKCAYCESEFIPQNKTTRYCSRRCGAMKKNPDLLTK